MNPETVLTFHSDGTAQGLYTEAIPLHALGRLRIRRATTIEFDNNTQYWRVRDRDGFPLFNSPSRQTCLDWERRYLDQQEDMKHELQHSSCAVAAGA